MITLLINLQLFKNDKKRHFSYMNNLKIYFTPFKIFDYLQQF
jgi:hypothetical protein